MFGDRVVGERMQTTEVEPRVELLNIRKVVGVEVKERNTLESGRLKPKAGGPGVVTGKEALSQRGVWEKDWVG